MYFFIAGFADRSLISAVDVATTSLAASPESVSARAALQLAQDRLSAAEVELLACASVDGAVFFLSLDSLRMEHVLLLNDENVFKICKIVLDKPRILTGFRCVDRRTSPALVYRRMAIWWLSARSKATYSSIHCEARAKCKVNPS
jgi:hypothetical protein